MEKKKCSKCGEIKEYSEFYKDSKGKDNLSSQCKSCINKYALQYRLDNKQKIKDKGALYYLNNKEKYVEYDLKSKARLALPVSRKCSMCNEVKEFGEFNKGCYECRACSAIKRKRHREKHHSELLAKGREEYKNNRERHLAYAKRYYDSNTEKALSSTRRWRESNKEKIEKYNLEHYDRKKELAAQRCENLTDGYVGSLIKCKFGVSSAPQELIDLKRAHLTAKREIRKRKKSSCDDKNI